MIRLSGILGSGILMAALASAAIGVESAGLDAHHLIIKSFLDVGHLVSGWDEYGNAQKGRQNISMLPLNRASVTATQEVTLGSLNVSVGLSGVVWWPYSGESDDVPQRIANVKPMIPVARARWQFGAPDAVNGSLQVGTFGYKYNPDAKNLGEYLYRAGTYPGFLWTNEGWLLMNRAGNYSHGALFTLSHPGGWLKHNFSLFMETLYYPIGDFSPGYDFSLTGKWLEFGGGAVLNHYLPIRPSLLKRKVDQNTYGHFRLEQFNANSGLLDTVDYIGPLAVPQVLSGTVVDTVEISHRWTFKGIKLMGRMAVKLGSLLPESVRGTEDLRFFAEAAVLGWEDQPLYYEKMMERIPFMFGVSLPTGKLLDALTLQGEYYKSPFNDINVYNNISLPIWNTDFVADSSGAALRVFPKSIRDDDFKWSVHAKKTVNKVMTLYAQAASDHFRLTDYYYKTSTVPLTSTPAEWYYLIRLEFSLP